MTINYLEQFLDQLPATAEAATPERATVAAGRQGGYLALVRALGARTAELHGVIQDLFDQAQSAAGTPNRR